MSDLDIYQQISKNKEAWLVTGAAGFIGTNLVRKLMELGQTVVGIDNYSTGKKENVLFLNDQAKSLSGSFTFVEGDICDLESCKKAFSHNIDRVLHNAAVGSVPRSIKLPLDSHASNVNGFTNVLWSAYQAGVKRFVYASSSSVYGDEETLPKKEERIGRPLSPYAATKSVNELYADVFSRSYGIETIGLRYFNVFGPHQQSDGAYAAVIPKWIGQMLDGEKIQIFGDGLTTRDFCFIDNVVQVNLRAAVTDNPEAVNQVYNVAFQGQTSLNELYKIIKDILSEKCSGLEINEPDYQDFRDGDIRHSFAEIDKAKSLLGYIPMVDVGEGLVRSIDWYIENHKKS